MASVSFVELTVAQLVQAEAAPRLVAVHLVIGVGDDRYLARMDVIAAFAVVAAAHLAHHADDFVR